MRTKLLASSAVALAAGVASLAVPTAAQAAVSPGAQAAVPSALTAVPAVPILLTPLLAPMLPGQTGWISTMWNATSPICNVKVTATGNDVSVSYPTNTATYSSLSKQSSLSASGIDYTAFKVSVNTSTTAISAVKFTMTYSDGTGDDCASAVKTVTEAAVLPIIAVSGNAVAQKTSSVTVSRSAPVWTQISFTGRKPGLADFRVSLTAPSGLGVTYPGDGTTAGLNLAPALEVGSDDYVSVRLDTSKMAAGTYTVPITATYTGGSYTGSLSLVVQ